MLVLLYEGSGHFTTIMQAAHPMETPLSSPNTLATCTRLYDSLLVHLAGLQRMPFTQQAYLADIAPVGKNQEYGFHRGQHVLAITHATNADAIPPLLDSYTQLMRRATTSSLFAKRFAGFIVVDPMHPCVQLIAKINALKDDIAACVRDIRHDQDGQPHLSQAGRVKHYRNHQQKHEFIHKAIPDVITAQCYRHIPVLTQPVRRISYYWATKHAHKSLTYEQAIQHITNYLGLMEMHARIEPTLAELAHVADQHLYVPRLQTNAVMATVNFADGTRKNIHSTVPLVIATEQLSPIQYRPLAEHTPTYTDYTIPADAQLICAASNVFARPHRNQEGS